MFTLMAESTLIAVFQDITYFWAFGVFRQIPKESFKDVTLLFFSFSRSELSHIANRHRVDGIYCEWGFSSIYFIMIPVIICFILTDGRMEIDRIFEARALYYVLQITWLWKLTDCFQILFTTQVSIERIEVLVLGVSEMIKLLSSFGMVVWFVDQFSFVYHICIYKKKVFVVA